MHKGLAFALIGATLVGGYFIGKASRGTKVEETTTVAGKALAPEGGGVERKRIPLSGEVRGPADALITIVEFSDFQCPFCGRVEPTLTKVMDDYKGKVRVYFKHYPLPFHQDAPLASEAALAAGAQGKFWEMHDKLFANQQSIKRPDLEKYGQELGLDMAKFRQALDTHTFKARIDQDTALGGQVGVDGTPAFYINGRLISGAQPYGEFKKIIDEELATAQKLMASGTPRARIYDKLMASGAGAPRGPVPSPNPAPPVRPPVPTEVYKVTTGDAPSEGARQPKVTIIEFSDFQCPFCGRVTPTLRQLVEKYPNDVQVAFKHLPLAMHNNAEIAALAAEAAREQGKFWQMHDKLFANQQALDRANLEKYAQELGLDVARFKAALDSDKTKQRVTADKTLADQFGVRGTPSFFVNGRKFVGAQPYDAFKSLVDEEITKADEKLKGGVARKDLYAAVIKNGLEKVEAPAPAPSAPPAAGAVQKVEIAGAPVKGPKDALITIVIFSDFQCPFCGRVEPTLAKVADEYKGKVRFVWRDFPLDFHQNAMPAAIASRVANAEGKFWQMHDKLFTNQQTLDRASLEKYAQEVGVNVGHVRSALDTRKYENEIKADMAMGQKVGVSGTPAFFINGVFLSGAQPYEAFKATIDQELTKAEALVKKGTPKAKVYDEIMKTAGAAPAPARAAAEPGGPDSDQTVYKVEIGKSPVRGPKKAPITVVLFSDFQCPFCSRVEPTIAELEKAYPGKIRVAWRDFPLEFHQNAKPAAMAARAAGEQGKFWEMHGKLFGNQQSLDRQSLEKYASELGLNMSKFKAALDSNKYSTDIEADMKAGQAAGVSGTPAAFINGRKISGAQPIDVFKKVVDQELAKVRKGS
jgi:protein-disulfide isomerase